MRNMKYIKSPNGKELYSEKQVLLCNTKTGGYLKTNKLYYEYMKLIMQESNGDITWDIIEDDYIRNNMKYLFSELLKIGYIIEKNDYDKAKTEQYEVVYLSITNKCNLHCAHCCVSAGEEDFAELSLIEWKFIIDQVIQLNPISIEVTGGEPLLYHDFCKLILYLREVYKGNISVSTNGLLVNKENIKVLRKNVDAISISVDGYDEESCKIIRGTGVFQKAIDRILFLKENGIKKISASMLITSYTEENKKKFTELCTKLDITPIYRRFTPTGRGMENYLNLMPQKSIYQDIEVNLLKCALCRPGKRELNVTYNGDIYPCAPLSSEQEFRMGNIFDKPLCEIINDNSFEEKIEKNRPWNIEKCSKCNVNLFCHTCINYARSIQQNPNLLKKICEQNKFLLTKAIWE